MRVIKSFSDYTQREKDKQDQPEEKPDRKSDPDSPTHVKDDDKMQGPANKVIIIPKWKTY
jgi:hypothetical protein